VAEDAPLSSRPPEMRRGEPAKVRLGGIVVYATSEAKLRAGVAEVGEGIVRAARAHASLDRRSLLSSVAKLLGHRLDQRVFDAIVGSQLRLGRIDRIPCQAAEGAIFRSVVAAERSEEFHRRCEELAGWLRETRVLTVRAVRERFFDEGWGTWSSASHLVGRLVLVGRARYVDRFTCAWPEGLERADG
jgi:hypothetical protein